MKPDLIDRVRYRVAQTAVGPSALRNQGGPNVVQRARRFLGRIDLNTFNVRAEARFRAQLDESTAELQSYLPQGARNWGTARKALSLFLRDASLTISAKPVGSWGCVSAVDSKGRTIWIADAHRGDGQRFIVHADEKLTAFLELQRI